MVSVSPLPKTRADEIVRARGLSRADVAERGGYNRSNLSRLLSGQFSMSVKNQVRLAAILECTVNDLMAPIGTTVPKRTVADRPPTAEPTDDQINYVTRVAATALMLGTTIDGLMRYQVLGDFTRIPHAIATRLRKAQKAALQAGIR